MARSMESKMVTYMQGHTPPQVGGLGYVIHDHLSPFSKRRFQLLLTLDLGTYGIDVGFLFYPGILDYGASRGSGDDQDIAVTGLLYLGGRMIISI
jgi:hypothetical protein